MPLETTPTAADQRTESGNAADSGADERSTRRLAILLALVLLVAFAAMSLADPIGHVLADAFYGDGPYGCGGG